MTEHKILRTRLRNHTVTRNKDEYLDEDRLVEGTLLEEEEEEE
jgi:hypothetical protein